MGPSTRQLLLGAALLGGLTTSNADAKDAGEPLRPGAPVRLFLKPTPDHITRERIMGLLIRADQDSVIVDVGAGRPSRAVPLGALQSLAVRNGRKSSAGKGALIGLASGVAGGVVAGKIVCSGGECDDPEGPGLASVIPTALAVGGGIFGTGMGALIGGRFHIDRWERVSVHDLRMGVEPNGDGLRLRLLLALP